MEASSPADSAGSLLPRLLACAALALLAWFATPGAPALRAGMAIFVLVGSLWVTQAVHLAVAALLVPVLAVGAGLATPRQALAPFAHPVIFLFLGGFALAAALSQQGLDRALAGAVLRLARGGRAASVLLLAALTAVLSMWMSNTATVALMLPLVLGLITGGRGAAPLTPATQSFVLLAVAYSASIGGMATLVGSPPNAIAAAQAGIGFGAWMLFGLPLALLLWPLMLAVLALVLRPQLRGRMEMAQEPFAWTMRRRMTAGIFGLTVLGWMVGAALGRGFGITEDMDTLVSLAALAALVATGCLHWRGLEAQVQWSVLLLFGGGLALSEVMAGSGASRFLAQGLLQLAGGAPIPLLFLALVLFTVLLTELVSNTASAALLVPLFLPVAAALGLPPAALAAAVAAASSCGFMLPVATPPNAIVFATDRVPQRTMMHCGLWLNLIGALVISALAAWAWR
jgi:sodium-dependent dicarboxylate transporter 2/3/5